MTFSFDQFTRLNSLSKTLRFELRPIGKTLDNLKKDGIFDRDIKRAEAYPEMKRILDDAHKKLLREGLSQIDIKNWSDLEKAYEDFRKDKSQGNKKKLENVQQLFRKKIVETLKKHPDFAALTAATPSDFIKELLKREDVSSDVERFNGFATYMSGFQENRKNIYSDEAQATSAANRAINENFPKFMMCVRIFGVLSDKYPEIISQAENELRDYLSGRKLADIFKTDSYSRFLSQTGIVELNTLIGGVREDGLNKLQGINEFINQYKQRNEDARNDRFLGKMPLLYKQILFDRETFSFVEKPFETDEDVINAVKEFGEKFNKEKTAEKITAVLEKLTDDEGIYVGAVSLSEISIACGKGWNAIGDTLRDYAENKFSSLKTQKQKDKAIEAFMKRPEFSLAELREAGADVLSFWAERNKINDVENTFNAFKSSVKAEGKNLQSDTEYVKEIKAFLDAVQNLLHFLKPLNAGRDLERNTDFYGEFDPLYDDLVAIIPLYNRVRNYVTKKPSETVKIKLMFDKGTLANGWDENSENANLAIILQKDKAFFLGIVNSEAKSKPDFKKLAERAETPCYRKMIYKLLPGPNKMLPKVFFSEKGIATYNPDPILLERYKRGDHKKNEPTFDLKFCHELIDFFKRSIEANSDWKKFGFKFSDTSTYQSIDEFYKEISAQGYKLSFENIPSAEIDALVESGDLFLFQIWNKDFSEFSNGRENLHTSYWRALFSPENLSDLVLKLNGGAELFWRQASIVTPTVHKTGEKMVNRRDADGETIPESIHDELYRYVNGKEVTLSEAARAYRDKIVVKDVKHDIVKDKRFTQDKFLFHMPFTINSNVSGEKKLNEKLNKCLTDNLKDVRFIGIDRGERHLIYLVMTDADGKIVMPPKSFNTVETVNGIGGRHQTDYHQKLDDREKERKVAQKSWKTIGKIKDLKEGYLSQIVHEISKLIIENNAVVILEDLNFGFKRGRFRIEKQVYQKFEKALIDKLNYLVFKNRDQKEAGGLLNGYQLTQKFDSFEKLGKQTGVLFYIPAAYTSKIDPTTGFTNLFNLKSCSSAKGIKDFFLKFDSIVYDEKKDAFAFSFNYDNFKTGQESFKKEWTVYSASRRLVYNKQTKADKEINPTMIIKDELRKAGAVLKDGYDLKAFMTAVEPSACTNFFKQVFYAFERTLQMRNSSASTDEDYIESPVLNKDGYFFDSRQADDSLPDNADANGAYHIALKGICMLSAMKNGKPQKLEHKEWFKFAQSRCSK